MPKDFSRSLRVNDQIQRELAELIRQEIKDPRVGMVTLTEVQVTPDYAHAKVFFTTLAAGDKLEQTQAGLNQSAGFLRRQLGMRIKLHTLPQLHFVHDNSVEHGVNLSVLIDKANAVSGNTPTDKDSDDSDEK